MRRKKKVLTVMALFATIAGCWVGAGGELMSHVRGADFQFTQTVVCGNQIETDRYEFFDYASDSGIVIPALEQNFVPQGICYWEEKDWLILSGYFRPVIEYASAVLLAVRASDGKLVGEYTLTDRLGKACGGHFAGVAVTETDLYVTNGYSLHRIPLREFRRSKNRGVLRVAETIPVPVDAGSCNYSDGILWICEHYQKLAYPLRGAHMWQNNDGTTYHAWMIGYRVTKQGNMKPYCVFSVPDRIQGITVVPDGRIVLSQSYGRTNPSHILLCEDPREKTPDGYVTVEGVTIPLWSLDEANGLKRVSAPPMSEGCCVNGTDVYVIFESAAFYYRAFTPENPALDPTDKIWKFTLAG